MIQKNYKIYFHVQKPVALKERKKLRKFISLKLKEAGKTSAEINYVFCSDEDLLEINGKYLNHHYYTDIITFDLSEAVSSVLVSDIFISVDRVKDNAGKEEVAMEEELLRVIFHGILHLLGYLDKTKSQSIRMREMEEVWLEEFSKFV